MCTCSYCVYLLMFCGARSKRKYKELWCSQDTLANWRWAAPVRQLMLVSLPHGEIQNLKFKKYKSPNSWDTKNTNSGDQLVVSRSDSSCLFFFLPENTKFTLLLGSFYSWRTTHNLIVSWKMSAKKANKKIIFLERTVGAVGPFHQLGLAPWQRTRREAAIAQKIHPLSIRCFPSPTF